MKTKNYVSKKYVFGYDTGYVNGKVEEEVELHFPISLLENKEELSREIEESYQEWLSNNIDTYWYDKES